MKKIGLLVLAFLMGVSSLIAMKKQEQATQQVFNRLKKAIYNYEIRTIFKLINLDNSFFTPEQLFDAVELSSHLLNNAKKKRNELLNLQTEASTEKVAELTYKIEMQQEITKILKGHYKPEEETDYDIE